MFIYFPYQNCHKNVGTNCHRRSHGFGSFHDLTLLRFRTSCPWEEIWYSRWNSAWGSWNEHEGIPHSSSSIQILHLCFWKQHSNLLLHGYQTFCFCVFALTRRFCCIKCRWGGSAATLWASSCCWWDMLGERDDPGVWCFSVIFLWFMFGKYHLVKQDEYSMWCRIVSVKSLQN